MQRSAFDLCSILARERYSRAEALGGSSIKVFENSLKDLKKIAIYDIIECKLKII